MHEILRTISLERCLVSEKTKDSTLSVELACRRVEQQRCQCNDMRAGAVTERELPDYHGKTLQVQREICNICHDACSSAACCNRRIGWIRRSLWRAPPDTR